MVRRWWLGACVIGLVCSVLLARQGAITMSDGRVMVGDIQDSPDGKSINLTIHGATLTIDRSLISNISYPTDANSDYKQRLSVLDPNDIKGRIDLARYELSTKQYDLAAAAAHDAERLDPHNPDVAILLDTIQSQRTLDTRALQHVPSSEPESAATQPAGGGKYLTDDDVFTIRLDELKPDDNVRVQFYNNVRKRYLAKTGGGQDFYSETPAQQALDILKTNDPSLTRDVKLQSDPAVLLEYRSQVQPRILAGCAAAGCHGSDAAGGFMLYPDARQTLPAYTNYYILEQTGRKVAGGNTFGTGPVYRPMINRLDRKLSLVLQFGLPQNVAEIPHPKAANFKPMFSGVSDPGFEVISRWIGSLSPIAPDYHIKYEIPTGKESTSQGS